MWRARLKSSTVVTRPVSASARRLRQSASFSSAAETASTVTISPVPPSSSTDAPRRRSPYTSSGRRCTVNRSRARANTDSTRP